MTKLSVNVNKIAVLRNSRGGALPSVPQAARTALECGAHGITVHPRPDARHIRYQDVLDLAQCLEGLPAEFNIEGNPFAPASVGLASSDPRFYPGLFSLVEAVKPAQVTLVPDADGQITSDHGFDLLRDAEKLAPIVAKYRALGVRVSVFVNMDASAEALQRACAIGIQRIEIYTGPFAEAYAQKDLTALRCCAVLASLAASLGLGVNAGHDLSQENLSALLAAAPDIAEVSIGHALFSEALYQGLSATINSYLQIIRRTCSDGP